MPVGPSPLSAAALGERWVVRHRLADGSATDTVGWLDQLGPDRLALTGVAGATQPIERATVILARRAPAALGGPDPHRTTAAELQRRALPGWLADHESLGEWTLRAGDGFTGRANSCLAVGEPGVDLAEAARRIVGYAASHAIAPMAQVITGSAADLALRRLGWTTTYETTDVLVVRLTALLERRPPSSGVTVIETLLDSWRATYRLSRPQPVGSRVLDLMLDGQSPRAYASHDGVEPGSLAAIGRGHLNGDWLGLAAIWTDPACRRAGLATAVMVALGHWGARRGARYAYLQVAVANQLAHQAYEQLGFQRHHTYGYLRPPS